MSRKDIERQTLFHLINDTPLAREQLEELYGQVWDPDEVAKEYALMGFQPPYAIVRRLADNIVGSLTYQDAPRFYFRFLLKNEDL